MAERVILVVTKKPIEVGRTIKIAEVHVAPKVAQIQPSEKNIAVVEPGERRVTDLLTIADQGPPGPPGPQGPEGPPGPEGIVWRGPWDADTDYNVDDVVEYEGASYIAVAPSVGAVPPLNPDKWDVVATVETVDGGQW